MYLENSIYIDVNKNIIFYFNLLLKKWSISYFLFILGNG